MNRLRRALYLLAVSLVVTLIALVFRVLTAAGVFTDVRPQFAGTCRQVGGVSGVEGIRIDREDGLVFVSSARASGPDKRDGLYSLPLSRPETGFTRLGGTPASFHPGGLSLFRGGDGRLVLMAVDHPAGQDPAVEIFDVTVSNGRASLSQRASITGGLLVSPYGVAAAGSDQFFVTNSSTSTTALGHALEMLALVPRGNVLYFDGNVFRVVANGLGFASGIQLSPDGSHVYVATTIGRALYTFARAPVSGSLNQVDALTIGSGLDDIDFDESGGLLVGAHPKLLDELLHQGDAKRRFPSQVFKVSLSAGVPRSAELVYGDPGTAISGAGVAAAGDGQLFIGSPRDSKVLVCRFASPTPR